MAQAGLCFQQGDYNQALAIWTSLLEVQEVARILYDCGTTYLILRDWRRALEHFERARAVSSTPAPKHMVPMVGVALWLSGERGAACMDWAADIARRQAGAFRSLDAAGGVDVPALLWWGSAQPGLSGWRPIATEELSNRWRAKEFERRGWPRPIAGYLLDQFGEAELLSAATAAVERLQERQLCAAHFYIGASHLAQGDRETYLTHLVRGLEYGFNPGDPEYHLALDEVGGSTRRT